MSDHLDRAAEVIYVEVLGLPAYSPHAVADHNRHSYRGDCQCNAYDRVIARRAAEELDAAGLLVTPERDAAVAARALRGAADTFARFANSASTSERSRHGWESARGVLLRMAEEREAGESDADA